MHDDIYMINASTYAKTKKIIPLASDVGSEVRKFLDRRNACDKCGAPM